MKNLLRDGLELTDDMPDLRLGKKKIKETLLCKAW